MTNLAIFSSPGPKGQVSLCHGAASVVRTASVRQQFHILNFFSDSTSGIYLKLARNGPEMMLTKCSYFSGWSEIQDGRHGGHLEKHLFNFFLSSTSAI